MALGFIWNCLRIPLPSASLAKFGPEKLKHTYKESAICTPYFLFFIFFIFYLVCFNFSSWHTILGFFLNCVKKIPNLFQNSCCNQGPIFNIYASFIHLYFFSVFSVVQFIVMSRGFVFVNLCNFG